MISEVKNMDCMDYMRLFPDKFFDLAVVDPPYGIGIDGQKSCLCKNPKHNRKHHEFKGWDIAPGSEYFKELMRVSRCQIIWGGNYFSEHLPSQKGWIVWYKGQQGLTMSDCELAWSSIKTPARVVTINRCELNKEGTIHPTQKPIALYAWIFKNFSRGGQKILDTHLGSGSSRIAAYKMGLDFYGCELDKEYFDKMEERFQQECHGVEIINNVTIQQGNIFENLF